MARCRIRQPCTTTRRSPPPEQNLNQCTALPALFYVGFGEVIALFQAYDGIHYDGDGFLSLEEIMLDRLPDNMAGIAAGLASAGVAEAGTTMVRNVPNLIGTLETLLRGVF